MILSSKVVTKLSLFTRVEAVVDRSFLGVLRYCNDKNIIPYHTPYVIELTV